MSFRLKVIDSFVKSALEKAESKNLIRVKIQQKGSVDAFWDFRDLSIGQIFKWVYYHGEYDWQKRELKNVWKLTEKYDDRETYIISDNNNLIEIANQHIGELKTK